MTYRDLPLDYLIEQYNPRAAVADHETWKAHWTIASARTRRNRQGRLRVAYGPTAGQTLDIFPASRPGAPINVFTHGGFWRFLDSFDHTLMAEGILDAGGAVILLNYDLCPSVPLTEVIRQVRSALKWVYENAAEANGDRDRIFISGHSAGAHLTAMMASAGCLEAFGLPADLVKGAACVSALFDLGPMLDIPGGEDLQLTPDTVPACSPWFNLPPADLPMIVAVGALETDEWLRQTDAMTERLRDQGNPVTLIKPEFDHHYSILFTLGDGGSELGKAVIDQMGLA